MKILQVHLEEPDEQILLAVQRRDSGYPMLKRYTLQVFVTDLDGQLLIPVAVKQKAKDVTKVVSPKT